MRLWGSMNVSLLQELLVGNYSVTHHPTTNQDHILTRHIQVMVNYLQAVHCCGVCTVSIDGYRHALIVLSQHLKLPSLPSLPFASSSPSSVKPTPNFLQVDTQKSFRIYRHRIAILVKLALASR